MKLKVFQGSDYNQLSKEIEDWKDTAYIFSVNTIYISELNDFLIFVYYDLRD